MIGNETLQATLDALKAAQSSPNMDLAKSSTFTAPGGPTTGINFYDLELGAKLLYPVLTPLRNDSARAGQRRYASQLARDHRNQHDQHACWRVER
jgi:hypothetical protein